MPGWKKFLRCRYPAVSAKPEWWPLWEELNGQLIKDRTPPCGRDLEMFREFKANHPTKDIETVLREAVDYLVGLKYDRGVKYKSARRFIGNQFAKSFGGMRAETGSADTFLSENHSAPQLGDYEQTPVGLAQYVTDIEAWKAERGATKNS